MVRHTSTVVAGPSQADTQLSPMSVAWSTNALIARSVGITSQDSPPSHGPIVLRCPGNGRKPPMGTVINPQRDMMRTCVREFRPTSLSHPMFLWHTLHYAPFSSHVLAYEQATLVVPLSSVCVLTIQRPLVPVGTVSGKSRTFLNWDQSESCTLPGQLEFQ